MREARVEKLENELSKYLLRRRIISAILFGVFLVTGIVFASIREATKEVVVHGEGFFSYETVTYNEYYAIGIVIGFLTATVIGCILFVDLIFCRFQTTVANTHYITVYRGMNKCSVYINGEEKDSIGMLSFTNVVDTKLPDGTKISVAFSRSAFVIAHISFSDSNSPIDL
ncbi:MAG: hypothetical protein IJF13_02805 [Clostridia bacterium]|nr:hypothetical protein [Clostridia bacterium]